MADAETHVSSEDKFGFLVRKVGPLPVWAWAVLAVGIYYWYTHYGPGAQSASASATPTADTGGNVTETVNTTTGPVTITKTPEPKAKPSPQPKAATHTPLNEIIKKGHVISNNPHHAVVGWTITQQTPYAKKLKIVLNGPGHKNQTRYIPANATHAAFENLSPHHTYVADVIPIDSVGQAIGGPNHITFITGG